MRTSTSNVAAHVMLAISGDDDDHMLIPVKFEFCIQHIAVHTCCMLSHRPTSKQVSNCCLSHSADEDDLSEVMSALLPIASRWKEVGIELKLKLADLDTIEAAHRNSPEDCLTNAVSWWLRKGYNTTKHGPPTWRKLVHAISLDAGGKNPSLAEKLAHDHLGTIILCIHNLCLLEVSGDVVVHTQGHTRSF